MDILDIKIEPILRECTSHAERIEWALETFSLHLPLNPGSLHALDNVSIAVLDQFLYRFTKLQDSMGTRLFPALASAITGNDALKPFIDILNLLEKVEVIKSVSDWQELRVLRNNLAHEYPDNDEATVAAINLLADQVYILTDILLRAKTFYQQKLSSRC
jgi:hypothetical protein